MRCFVPDNRKRLFRLNLQMFKKSTGALTLSFLLVLESSGREPQRRLPATALVENKIVRARDLGIPFGGTPGKFNAIADVAGVEVGYTTLISGEGKLEVGKGPVRTGVTVIIPRGHDSLNDPVYAGFFSLNGNGEMTGTAWLEESGFLEGPIVITNTHSVGIARDAVITWRVKQAPADKTGYWWSLPVVAETWDGWLNDVNGFHVKTAGETRVTRACAHRERFCKWLGRSLYCVFNRERGRRESGPAHALSRNNSQRSHGPNFHCRRASYRRSDR